MLRALPLPPTLDLIIDDASHALAHQLASLEALWPKLAPGGIYIVEDLTVGALPWLKGAAGEDQIRRAPSNNTDCKGECHYVQRPSEHPFIKRLVPVMAEQKAAQEALRLGPGLPRVVEGILDRNSWHWTVTGAHRGGGLDSTLIIEKTERPNLASGDGMLTVEQLLAANPPPTNAVAAAVAAPEPAISGTPAGGRTTSTSASTSVYTRKLSASATDVDGLDAPAPDKFFSHAATHVTRSVRSTSLMPSVTMLFVAVFFCVYVSQGSAARSVLRSLC